MGFRGSAPPLATIVWLLSKLFKPTEPYFSHVLNGNNDTRFVGLFYESARHVTDVQYTVAGLQVNFIQGSNILPPLKPRMT